MNTLFIGVSSAESIIRTNIKNSSILKVLRRCHVLQVVGLDQVADSIAKARISAMSVFFPYIFGLLMQQTKTFAVLESFK